ncbi:hypothetical protein JX265_010795 [Neoarthrinium moseri]|uniref:Uncharacterized protein n=1 Tax=Neoarthrinium moseri TaxID=1658444 RepID=A0A9P9WD60_9PEZI|nr:uncharacterized protein JN550_010639 [Neoarthrinium moseri]KAI1840210.1 hypothetical protein JX266_013577 [Neoarthrinium moseri]KAI1858127.1 hypothetical protein JX265_010795 [Neoarthrinium moseri]KAI1862008.1 hypothetical protein JN550_010639 [Neoarthrinium moseri]
MQAQGNGADPHTATAPTGGRRQSSDERALAAGVGGVEQSGNGTGVPSPHHKSPNREFVAGESSQRGLENVNSGRPSTRFGMMSFSGVGELSAVKTVPAAVDLKTSLVV